VRETCESITKPQYEKFLNENREQIGQDFRAVSAAIDKYAENKKLKGADLEEAKEASMAFIKAAGAVEMNTNEIRTLWKRNGCSMPDIADIGAVGGDSDKSMFEIGGATKEIYARTDVRQAALTAAVRNIFRCFDEGVTAQMLSGGALSVRKPDLGHGEHNPTEAGSTFGTAEVIAQNTVGDCLDGMPDAEETSIRRYRDGIWDVTVYTNPGVAKAMGAEQNDFDKEFGF
jgi:hypothetical protein